MDILFQKNTADNCLLHQTGMPCCRQYQIKKEPYNLVSKWGSTTCDTSPLLLEKSLEWISDNIDNIDFIINTGDSADHHVAFQTLHGNINTINLVQEYFEKLFPTIPIINVLGNHDTYPIDQTFPLLNNYIYYQIGHKWKTPTTFYSGGYYNHMLKHLCLLITNTLHFDDNNIYSKLFPNKDYDDQLNWIEKEIKYCGDKGKKIWLLNHEPPGKNKFSKKFFDLIYRNKNNIIHQFYGHRHSDQFILFKKNNEIFSSGFIPPSFMPDNHNPAFRVYEYNGTHIENYIQYTNNLKRTSLKNKINFEISYNFINTFNNVPTTDGLINVYNKMKKNDTVLHQYCSNYYMKNCKKKEGLQLIDKLIISYE